MGVRCFPCKPHYSAIAAYLPCGAYTTNLTCFDLTGDISKKVDGRGMADRMKFTAGNVAPPERSDSTSSVDSRSSVISRRGEGGMSAKHGRKPQQAFSKLAVERSDSTSSIDSHGSISRKDAGERVVSKHGRKPQHVYPSGRKTTGGGGEEEEEDEEEEDGRPKRAKSLSISVDWGALPSHMSLSGGNTPTAAPAGGFSFASETVEGKGKGKAVSPTLVSLPLVFSARADPTDGATATQPSTGGASGSSTQKPSVTPKPNAPPPFGGPSGNLERLGNILQKLRDNPVPVDAVRQVIAANRGNIRRPTILSSEGLPFSPTRGECNEASPNLVLKCSFFRSFLERV